MEALEALAVGLNFTFLILIIREKTIGWPFGILGSAISIYLFIDAKLYSEALLYSFYVVMGVYAWYYWAKNTHNAGEGGIQTWSWMRHLVFTLAAGFGTFLLGFYFKQNTDAAQPYADSGSTMFSFLATYMEAQKVLSGWIYWIAINLFSVWLYYNRGLSIYAGLMVIYGILSVVGYWKWTQRLNIQNAN
ncbi:MAG: nicotinamide mononucleotide transporter [Flavobacteriales bacterium]|nr:nicotinamide mononucleotide transporter [Flavobacteriales bacterium]